MADWPGHDEFDVVVIGAGPAGEIVAGRAARGGLTVAVVEARLAGGECSYYACIPSKTLLYPLAVANQAARTPGVELRGGLDAAAVLARRDETVSGYDDTGQVGWIEGVPAAFVRGRGRLAGPRVVEVDLPDGGRRVLRARHAVAVATGTEPVIPDIPGLAAARPWTNREATATGVVPRRLVVIGGGPVGCELAQALHGLGAAETTLLVRGPRLLPRAEPFAGELLAGALRAAGLDVRLRRGVTRVERPLAGGPVTVWTDDGERLEADEILVATGRRPAVAWLGLDTVGLPADRPIEVDASLRATGVADGWLYAAGDVNGRNLLTHMAKYQARICGDVIAARAAGRPDDAPGLRDIADERATPQVVFTDPQVCWVGRTEAEARADGFAVQAVAASLADVAGATVQSPSYTGQAQLVIDTARRVVLGATFVGPDVADLLHSATIAVAAEVGLDLLWHAVAPFPTVSEVWLRLLEAAGL
ncbi:MAG: NAD(P)/FAD-dependent oxidoreductase [Frankia sp.]|nr:NAD(P)/FAD-dependent oxidoreductase [Frankia sp.]